MQWRLLRQWHNFSVVFPGMWISYLKWVVNNSDFMNCRWPSYRVNWATLKTYKPKMVPWHLWKGKSSNLTKSSDSKNNTIACIFPIESSQVKTEHFNLPLQVLWLIAYQKREEPIYKWSWKSTHKLYCSRPNVCASAT